MFKQEVCTVFQKILVDDDLMLSNVYRQQVPLTSPQHFRFIKYELQHRRNNEKKI